MRRRVSVIVSIEEDGEGETIPERQVSLLHPRSSLLAPVWLLVALQVRWAQ